MTLPQGDSSGTASAAAAPDADASRVPRGAGGPLTVAAVAARLGVAPATLRTWDRRYGLGPSERSAGSHRRYTGVDVERLLVMRRLTLDGVAPGDAARLALLADLGPAGAGTAPSTAPGGGAAATPAALLDAALAGDRAACGRLVALRAGAGRGEIEEWWAGLVEPVLSDVARRTVVDRPGQDAGLVLRGCAAEAIAAWLPEGRRGAVVLVLVPPGQERPLVAQALAAALVAGGADARIVGGPVGRRHALELVVMTRPVALVTVSARADADLSLVDEVAAERPDLPQLVMVPDGGAPVPVGPSVQRSRSFRGLLHEVLALTGGAPNG
ncbi:MerR family transcriptional regulator [Cellulomonas sp. DKR-3]|uniref:MerR family transcriptional regulator n=1 Tax=Cellulomonas fulva TaxID=2835530 RepID=A0ABS5TYZ6_9CELL|nr:MerR family transcriptional regulator [Cellulomonas fulva]MBT0994382.1 MerR family transcriptional regulator [Cellulomonas fulva]